MPPPRVCVHRTPQEWQLTDNYYTRGGQSSSCHTRLHEWGAEDDMTLENKGQVLSGTWEGDNSNVKGLQKGRKADSGQPSMRDATIQRKGQQLNESRSLESHVTRCIYMLKLTVATQGCFYYLQAITFVVFWSHKLNGRLALLSRIYREKERPRAPYPAPNSTNGIQTGSGPGPGAKATWALQEG